MSRAFVSESDGAEDEQVPEFRNPLPPGARNYMTPEGAVRLSKELNDLLSGERPTALSAITKLKASGEEADAGSLKQALFSLMVLDKKIEYLSRLASTMEIVEPRTANKDTVGFGAEITLRRICPSSGNPVAGTEVRTEAVSQTYRIVGAYESDPAEGNISWFSPLAKALIGKRAGSRVTIKLPEGETELEILSVRYY